MPEICSQRYGNHTTWTMTSAPKQTPAKQILKFTSHESQRARDQDHPFLKDDLSLLLKLSQGLMVAH